ncbi:MAG: hypothetical protein MH137_13965 [Flavobacteriales bacterium]|nr:hypothetical protein [Flavobacteriales bacterium]
MQLHKSLIVLFFLSLLTTPYFWGCGNSADDADELEGFIFDTIPTFEKDTFIYPIATRSSSFRFPENFGGEVNVIDGKFDTYWQTIPGLITGEFIEFDFDSLYIGSIYVHITKDLRYGDVKNLLIYTEGELLGNFPAGNTIFIQKKVNTLRIEMGETQGINRVDLPLAQDSDRTVLMENQHYESVYTSKSIAVSEVDFYDEKNNKIPLRSVPVKQAKMNFYGTRDPYYINNPRMLFDGNSGFGWKGPSDIKDKTLLFSFDEDQIIQGIYFPYSTGINLKKIGFRLRKRPLPEYAIKITPGKGIYIELKNTLKGKNFEFVILETLNDEDPTLAELLFFDGSRKFSIYSDSLDFFQKQRLDSARNSPLEQIIDSRQKYAESYTEFTRPLIEVFHKNKADKDSVPVMKSHTETIFRLCSNGSFGIYETTRTTKQDNTQEMQLIEKKAEGYWFSVSKSKEESKLLLFADFTIKMSRIIPGKPIISGKERKQLEFEANIIPGNISFSREFHSLKTGN